MRRVFFDEKYQSNLIEKGYATMPLLSEDEINFTLRELFQLSPDDNFAPDGDGLYQLTYHCTFLDTNVEYRRKANNLIKEVFTPHIQRILVDYKFHYGNFFIKQPGKGEFRTHLHPPLFTDLKETAVTFWCPLVDVDESNGTLQVIEGSHKIIPEIQLAGDEPYFKYFEDKLFDKYMTPIILKAGESLAFDDNLTHGSKQNDSSKIRIAVQVTCVPNDVNTVFFFPNNENSSNKYFDVFEVDGQFFVENSVIEMFTPPPSLKKITTIENKNHFLTEKEFDKLLKNGSELRRKIYFSDKKEKVSVLNKIKSLFGI